MQSTFISSPLNYTGGKFRLLPQILPLFPEKINTFVDLFCGGCNVSINIDAQHIICNDNLTYLIDLYKVFKKKNEEEIIDFIDQRITDFQLSMNNEDGYKALRQMYNEQRNPLDLFVLVAYSFNHQIRFNNSHEFNNPFGRNRSSFNPKMRHHLVVFLKELHHKNIVFSNKNFSDFDIEPLTQNDFVYCDPPYLITTGTYNDGKRGFTGWNEKEEQNLLDLLTNLNRKNIQFALSNVLIHKGKENNLLQNWMKENDFHVTHLQKNYVNSNYQIQNRDKTQTDEVLVTNYTPTIKNQQMTLGF